MRNTRMISRRRYVRDSKDIWNYIWNHFRDERTTDKFLDIVEDVIDRIDFDNVSEDNISDVVYEEIDNSLIYDEDQWTMMAHYQRPSEADFDEAFGYFVSDIEAIVEDIISDREPEEE